MMIVVTDPKTTPGQLPDHRPSPHTALVAGGQRTCFDQRNQLLVLRSRQSRLAPETFSRSQPLGISGLEPLQPAIDGTTRHVELRCLLDHADAIKIAQDRRRSPPRRQIAVPLRLLLQFSQCAQFLPSCSFCADSLTIARSRHHFDPLKRDRTTMTFSRSSVNSLDRF